VINTKFKKNKFYFFAFSLFLFFYLTFISAPIPGNALEGDLTWVYQIGGSVVEQVNDVVVDSSGNVYSVGIFSGSNVDFNPGAGVYNLSSAGSDDVFISKVDSNKNFLWAHRIGNASSNVGYSINLDSSNNIYITGTFSGTVDFDPDAVDTYNLISSGGNDMFVLKLDSTGDFLWAHSFGGTSQDTPDVIKVDGDNNVYFAGKFQNTVDFDPDPVDVYNLSSAGNIDVFISKLDQSGDFLWAHGFGGTGFESIKDINLDTNNNIYLTGAFQNTVDFDPDLVDVSNITSVVGDDIFITKFDSTGDFVWAKSIGNANSTTSTSLSLDQSNNAYLVGSFAGTVDFNPDLIDVYDLISSGSVDGFILKLDSGGNFTWAKHIEGVDSEQIETISIDSNNNLYISGSMEGLTDFDPGVGVYNLDALDNHSIFLSKLDSSGGFVWAKQIGGNIFDQVVSSYTDNLDNLYLVGSFFDVGDFDPNLNNTFELTSNGSWDGFILKLGDGTGPVISEVTPIVVLVNNINPSYTFTTNEAGTITYGGSCSSATTGATVGSNTITLNSLNQGTYSNCTITVTDALSNVSNILTITSFDVVLHSGGGGGSTPTPTEPAPTTPTPETPVTPTPTEPVVPQPEIVIPIVTTIPTEPITPPVVCNQGDLYSANTGEACTTFIPIPIPVIPIPTPVEEVVPVTPKPIETIKEPEIVTPPFTPETPILTPEENNNNPIPNTEPTLEEKYPDTPIPVREETKSESILEYINRQAQESFKEFKDIFVFYLDKIKEIFNNKEGDVVLKIVTTSGLLAGLSVSLASAIFSSPLSFAEIPLIPFRIWSLLMSALGIKKRTRRWGVVYDSVTKQPLDPAYVTLKNLEGQTVATAITDIDGRYGFIVEPGAYALVVNKTNYIFPSAKLSGRHADELYDNIYWGDYFNVSTSGEVITKNIPLDPVNFSWNEFEKEKRKLTSSFNRKDLLISRIANVFFNIGFVLACIAFIVTPLPYNGIIFSLYIFIFILKKIGIKTKNKGSVIEKSTGLPLSYGIVRVMYSDIGQEVAHSVIDKYGNFYCLVKNGTFTVKIDKKNADGSYTTLYQQALITVDNGVLNKNFEV